MWLRARSKAAHEDRLALLEAARFGAIMERQKVIKDFDTYVQPWSPPSVPQGDGEAMTGEERAAEAALVAFMQSGTDGG